MIKNEQKEWKAFYRRYASVCELLQLLSEAAIERSFEK